MLAALGAALFMIVPLHAGFESADMSRVVQGLVAGIGFLGAGVILKMDDRAEIRGVTTAATIWVTAALGMTAGLGQLVTAIVSTVVVLIVLAVLPKLEPRSKAPLFQSAPRRSVKLSGKGMHRSDVWAMVKRRCAAAGLSANICNHSFRATGITIHQENGGRIEDAAELAGHASTRTTQLYNHKGRKIARAEVERVQL